VVSSSLSDGIMSWLNGPPPDNSWKLKDVKLRRYSSRDIEEAMSGGISKVDNKIFVIHITLFFQAEIYMPPL